MDGGMGAFSQHPLQPTTILNPPHHTHPYPTPEPSPASFLPSFWFLLISLVNICLSFTIPYFFSLVFLLSPPLESRSRSTFKNDFGFDAVALGCLQTSLDTGVDYTARPGLTTHRAEALLGDVAGRDAVPRLRWGPGCSQSRPWATHSANSLSWLSYLQASGFLTFSPGFLKAWPGSVGNWDDVNTRGSTSDHGRPRHCSLRLLCVHSHPRAASGPVTVISFFSWREGSTGRLSDLCRIAHLREPRCDPKPPAPRSVILVEKGQQV